MTTQQTTTEIQQNSLESNLDNCNVVVDTLVRSSDDEDVVDIRGQITLTCIIHVEIQRPQEAWLTAICACHMQ